MKTRNGFVSNSSSASFICYWRCLNTIDNDPLTMKEAISRLFGYYDGGSSLVMDEVIAQTIETSSTGTFKTEMWTSMYNDITDVPISFAYLITGLKAMSGDGYELIDFKIDGD